MNKSKNVYKIWLCLGLSLCGQGACGQSFAEVREKMIEAYKSANVYSLDVRIKTSVSELQSFIQNAQVHVNGTDFWYKWGETEVLGNDSYLISVNHDYEMINVQVRDASDVPGYQQMFQLPDTLIADYSDKIVMINQDEELLQYRLSLQEPPVEIDIYIDASSYWLKRLVYHKSETLGIPDVQIDYEKLDLAPDPQLFNEKRYIKREGNFFSGTGRCENYALHSQ